jgi:hypothetical protein
MTNTALNSAMFSNMQTGKPLVTYKKTILAKVYVTTLNPFSNEPEGIILEGNPETNDLGTMIDIWNDTQLAFFKRMNRKLLEQGLLLAFDKPENIAEMDIEKYADSPDEELEKILKSPYYSIVSALNATTSEAVVGRFLLLARKLEKSEKIIKVIEARLAELQSTEYQQEE